MKRLHGAASRLLGAASLFLGVAHLAFAQGTATGGSSTGLWQTVAHTVINPWATIFLLVVGCLLLFIDLLTPFTWGASGTIGVICVGLVFASQVTEGTGGWIGIVLMLGGVVLLLLETHVIPGHGMAAIGGLLLLFLGMFWALGGSAHAAFALSVSTVLTVMTLIGFFAYLPKSPVWKQLGQEMRQHAARGFVANHNRMFLLGSTGVSMTALRPKGVADFHGMQVDVVTEGDFLEPGTPLLVTHVEGERVVVERAQSGADSLDVGGAAAL